MSLSLSLSLSFFFFFCAAPFFPSPLPRFLKTSWFKFGLTARLHRYAEALIVAAELNRTLITPVPGLEYGLFKPRTSCSKWRFLLSPIHLMVGKKKRKEKKKKKKRGGESSATDLGRS